MSKIFGIRLKELRLKKDFQQKELAEVLSTKQQNISRWENGEFEAQF